MEGSRELESFLKDRGLEGFHKYYSVYFGEVQPSEEQLDGNVILVSVPEVYGVKRVVPATPRGVPSGKGWGYNFVPKPGEVVWVTFRFGSPRFPLWEPGYYAEGERPEEFNQHIVGHKYRDGAISIYDEENHQFRLLTPNGTIVTTEDDNYQLSIPDGISLKVEKENFEFTLKNGDSFKYSSGAFNAHLASGPRIELGSSGLRLAGHGAFSTAVLGEPLVSLLTSLLSIISQVLPILISHDAAVGNLNTSAISSITTQVSQAISSINNILAT